MKKFILMLLVFILFPLNITAVEITETEIIGTTEKNIGEEITLDFKINLSGIEKGIDKTLGVWLTEFELIFDNEILSITDISSEAFNSSVYKKDDKYYVISEVIENSSNTNICSNEILYCGNYAVSIKFYIKNTESKETIIKMTNSEISLLDIIDETKTYTMDDIIKVNNSIEKTHTIKINKTDETITEESPTEIILTTNPINKLEKEINKNNKKNKSSNAFIENMKVENYDIDFEKNKTNYNITVLENINKLDIDITLDDELATYRVIGSDDIKGNNNEIAIIVTAEDGNTLTYTINIKYTDKIEEKESEKQINIINIFKKYIIKDNLAYIGIGIGIIIIIILLIILKNKKENKKINKLLGEL